MQEKGSAVNQATIAAANEQRRASQRQKIMVAMLELSGEVGYEATTVRLVLSRSGGNSNQFYRHFRNKASCFAAAHEVEVERLYGALIDVARRKSSWRLAVRAALAELFGFVVDQPLIARAILKEPYVAGGKALAKHEEVLERLSAAINGTCYETTEPRHSPPPMTASFMVGAIERCVQSRLAAGEPQLIWAAMPELMYLLVGPYFGDQAAREELARPMPDR